MATHERVYRRTMPPQTFILPVRAVSMVSASQIYLKFRQELIEAFLLVLIIHVVADRTIQWQKMLRITLVLAVIITVLELYDPELQQKVKEGVRFSAGSSVVS